MPLGGGAADVAALTVDGKATPVDRSILGPARRTQVGRPADEADRLYGAMLRGQGARRCQLSNRLQVAFQPS